MWFDEADRQMPSRLVWWWWRIAVLAHRGVHQCGDRLRAVTLQHVVEVVALTGWTGDADPATL